MMQVRVATLMDLSAYRDQARMFHMASPVRTVIAFDDTGYAEFYVSALTNPDIGMWLAEDSGTIIGIAGAILYPIYFSPSVRAAQELWWYLTPKARGVGAGAALFTTIERWASDQEARIMFMIALEDSRVDSMVKVYGRSGYMPTERTFMKEL